jgi:hypothetical protein
MNKMLPIILTVTILATTAKAGLGWSLKECIQHYEKPEYTNSDPFTDLLWYHFKTKGFEIQALHERRASARDFGLELQLIVDWNISKPAFCN